MGNNEPLPNASTSAEGKGIEGLRSHIDPILRAMEEQIVAVRAILATSDAAPDPPSPSRRVEGPARTDDCIDRSLTSREREVLALLRDEGASNGAIAVRLGIRERTVKAHLRSIFRKLDVTSRSEAIVAALASDRP